MERPASLFAYLGMVGGLIGLLATRHLFSPVLYVVAPQVAALVLMLWARFTFGRRSYHLAANPTAGGLVTAGPYQYIRHPIYTAICLFTVPAVIAHTTWDSVLFGAMIVGCVLVRMLFEEKLLVTMYPEYEHYAAKTRRMIPFVF